MSDDREEFCSFIRKLAFQHTELYLDDAKRICRLATDYGNGAKNDEVKRGLIEACGRLIRKIVDNRAKHPNLHAPNCVRLLGSPLTAQLTYWNTAARIAPAAKLFLIPVQDEQGVPNAKGPVTRPTKVMA